ncbi:efflux RND transporter periplasmic adaptor subunit [bacterium]|nr:efflux RND transporter periplasmic adaptor subunit [bacterium]
MKMLGRIIVVLLALAFLGAVMGYLAGWFTPSVAPEHVAPPIRAAADETVAVEHVQEPVIEQATGTMRAKNETSVSPRITASIVSINVRSGDRVEEGDVLITLDDRDLVARVRQAEKSVMAAQAKLDDAKSEFERKQALFEQGVASESELDRAQADYKALQAEVARAERGMDEAEASLSYATIKSPITGRVIDRYAEPGDTVTPGQSIVKLYDPKSLRLEADVRESLATKLATGDQLDVRIDALNQTAAGEVDEIVPQSQSGSRSFLVKVSLPPVENLYPGMFGRLLIPTGEVDRLYVPQSAIARVGQLEFVLVEEQGDLVRRFVRTGMEEDSRVEVLSGLTAAERIAPKVQ